VEIARRLVASGRIDFLNVIRGHIETDEALSHVIPGMGARSAPHLDFAGEIRAATKFPVFHAARIQDVATARHAVATGKLDMVGMTRAHIADPHIARKVAEGRESEIRPCVGMGYCIDRIYFGGEALCAHNAATGREAAMPHLIAASGGKKRKVVVVGAGPAGLEAARVAAARGHAVIVFEAAAEPGGQLRLAAKLARRREILGISDWRVDQCDKHGVQFRLNTLADAEDVLSEQPDVVFIATGGVPNLSFLEAGDDLVTTSWDILSGAAKPAESVLLFDDNGADAGLTVAEFIAGAGSRLEIATPERSLAPEVGGTNYPAYFKTLSERNATISLNLRLEKVARSGNRLSATLFNEYDKSRRERLVDQVVVEHGTLPLEDLYFALKPGSRNLGEIDHGALIANRPQQLVRNPDGGYALYRIGDAVASRNIHAAVYDALRLAKDI
jgi:NADPH-dependent 2,4-dienoyl-CoA reductase/sulfur reductase-like enzyme